MPTLVPKSIGATNTPTNPDYPTLALWIAACPANLVTADQIWQGNCLDQGEFVVAGTVLTISGITTDATRYVQLQCAAGASFKDKAGVRTTALFYNASNGVAIRNSSNYNAGISSSVSNNKFSGLQVSSRLAAISPGSGNTIDHCILNSRVGNSLGVIDGGAGGAAGTARNCLLVTNSASSVGVTFNWSLYGCTIINLTSGGTMFSSANSADVVKNCAVFGFTTFKSATLNAGSDYNATDLATGSGGAHDVLNLTFASQFVSSTTDFRAVNTGGLKAGTPDATNTPDDISGTTRDLTTPYIGAWEVVTAAAYNPLIQDFSRKPRMGHVMRSGGSPLMKM